MMIFALRPEDERSLGHTLRGVSREIEIAIMTLLMIGIVAAFLWLVSFSMTEADDARRLAEAISMAETMAEEFSANPSSSPKSMADTEADLIATCVTVGEEHPSGILFRASICVRRMSSEDEVYSLESARYDGDADGSGHEGGV